MLAINTSTHSQTVAIILANGKADSINLQPKSRAHLPLGSSVDPKRVKSYSSYIRFHDDSNTSVQTTPVAQAEQKVTPVQSNQTPPVTVNVTTGKSA